MLEKSFNIKKLILLFCFVFFSFLIQFTKAKISINVLYTYVPVLIFSIGFFSIFEKKFHFNLLVPSLFLLSFAFRQKIVFNYTLDELSVVLFLLSFLAFKYSILIFILSCILNVKLLIFLPLYFLFGEIPNKNKFKKWIDLGFFASTIAFTIYSIIFSSDHLIGRLFNFFDPRFKAMYIFFVLGFSLFPWRLEDKKNKKSLENLKYLGFGVIFYSFFNFSLFPPDISLLLFFGGLHFILIDFYNSVKKSFTALLSFITYLFFCGIY